MPLNAIKHPLIAHKIALLRQQGISTKQFRELANEVASLLTYEATRDLPIENREINGWQGEPINTEMLTGKKLSIVPILRAGLGMLDGVLTLVPNAKVSIVGLYRDEETLNPVAYFDKVINELNNLDKKYQDKWKMIFNRYGVTEKQEINKQDDLEFDYDD